MAKRFVITIARGFGSGGKEIGMNLSKELGIPCYDRQILTMASDQSGIDESIFVETNEKLRGKYIANFLRKVPVTGVLEPWEREFTSDVNVFNIQADIIRSLANTESCIIIGKCADDKAKREPINLLPAPINTELIIIVIILEESHGRIPLTMI